MAYRRCIRVGMLGFAILACACHPDEQGDVEVPGLAPLTKGAGLASLLPVQQEKIHGNGPGDGYFGSSVALSGTTAIIGEPYTAAPLSPAAGNTKVFMQSAGSWALTATLAPADGEGGDTFGQAVALSGDTALVGAPHEGEGYDNIGSAYVFERKGVAWSQTAKLVASDHAHNRIFGQSVALEGDMAIIGDPAADAYDGAAYVFQRVSGQWTEIAKLSPSDGGSGTGSFGYSVALKGDMLVIGAPASPPGGVPNSFIGLAYVFTRSGDQWIEQAVLSPSDGAENDYFGQTVAIADQDTIMVGVPGGPDGWKETVYVYVRQDGAWVEQAMLKPEPSSVPMPSFGASLAVSGDMMAIGRFTDSEVGANAGAVYLYERDNGQWMQKTKLFASDAASSAGSSFGIVALENNSLLVGAYLDDDPAPASGSAYSFVLQRDPGKGCLADAECITGFCVDGVCCDSACSGGEGGAGNGGGGGSGGMGGSGGSAAASGGQDPNQEGSCECTAAGANTAPTTRGLSALLLALTALCRRRARRDSRA